MKAYGGSRRIAPHILNLDARYRSGQYYDPAALTPGKGLGAHLIAGWVGLRADLSKAGWVSEPTCPRLGGSQSRPVPGRLEQGDVEG